MQEKNEINFIYNTASHKLILTTKKECWFFMCVSQLRSGVLFGILKGFKVMFKCSTFANWVRKAESLLVYANIFLLIAQSYVLPGKIDHN